LYSVPRHSKPQIPAAARLHRNFHGTRLSAKESPNQEDNGLEFAPNIYPNPTPENFTVQFVVRKPNSHVRLEIIDNSGKYLGLWSIILMQKAIGNIPLKIFKWLTDRPIFVD
jgi:hypothetical protein